MTIVRIKMLQDFLYNKGTRSLIEGDKYYAIDDAGYYWSIQDGNGTPFTVVVPRVVKRVHSGSEHEFVNTAEIVLAWH
ncbi:hypothetical protein LCGC14_0882610 [marine sediment metagenome]|uniref:Uncharacterized protein n=1 Tax=marine sediment metagenome TaxID=412755 RepID=A0A0F9S8D3_9ZZZZ